MNNPTLTDDTLTVALAEALDVCEVPSDDMVRRACGLFALRDFDAKLLTLLTDSMEGRALTMRSGESMSRVLTYRSESLTVDVVLHASGTRTLTGQIDPVQPATVEMITTEETVAIELDHHGRFHLSPVPDGAFRVLAVCADGGRFITPILSM